MTGWVGVDSRLAVYRRQAPRSQGQHARPGGFDVIDHDVEVHLLRPGRVRPPGRLEVRGQLEADPRGRVAGRHDREVVLLPGDGQPEQPGVERGQRGRVGESTMTWWRRPIILPGCQDQHRPAAGSRPGRPRTAVAVAGCGMPPRSPGWGYPPQTGRSGTLAAGPGWPSTDTHGGRGGPSRDRSRPSGWPGERAVLITVTWLRLDARRRWRSLAVLALLIALATATVLTSVAGARRGESAWNRLWARTLPATATVLPNQPGFDWARIAALPDVAALTRFPVSFGFEAQGYSAESGGFPLADDQMTRTIERPVILAGRLFNPHRADEVVVTPKFAAASGKHVGDSLTLELASVQQADEGYDGSSGAPAGPRIRARITGVIRSPWYVSADTPGSPGGVIPTPALFTRYRANIMGSSGQVYVNALIRLKGGEAAIPAFRAALARVTGRDDIDVWDNSVNFGDPIRRVTAYEAACLLAFGLAALVAALFLIGQSVARYTSATAADLQVLQSVGLTRRQAIAAAAAGPFLAGLAGATLGVAGAIVASRWMPIGLASIAEPHPGIDVDWVVLGPGWVIVPDRKSVV